MFLTNFEVDKNAFIFKNMHLKQNCSRRHQLCSPPTTQHNYYFFKIRIFENLMALLCSTNSDIVNIEKINFSCLENTSVTM